MSARIGDITEQVGVAEMRIDPDLFDDALILVRILVLFRDKGRLGEMQESTRGNSRRLLDPIFENVLDQFLRIREDTYGRGFRKSCHAGLHALELFIMDRVPVARVLA